MKIHVVLPKLHFHFQKLKAYGTRPIRFFFVLFFVFRMIICNEKKLFCHDETVEWLK